MVEDIREFVKNKRIIFVGNSVEIMEHQKGDFIDSYDIVVRFGRAIKANALQEKSIGTKCDIWVTGQFRAPSFNSLKKEFATGKFKNTRILINRSRGNIKLKDWILEDRLPKDFPEYTQMYSDKELIRIWKEFGKDILDTKIHRPSAGFITLIWFIDKIKTYKSIDLIGFDFFSKQLNANSISKKKVPSNCKPHSWHLPVYVWNESAHDSELEMNYVSFLQRRGLVKWHLLSDLKKASVKYTGWMKGESIVVTAPKFNPKSTIVPRSQQ